MHADTTVGVKRRFSSAADSGVTRDAADDDDDNEEDEDEDDDGVVDEVDAEEMDESSCTLSAEATVGCRKVDLAGETGSEADNGDDDTRTAAVVVVVAAASACGRLAYCGDDACCEDEDELAVAPEVAVAEAAADVVALEVEADMDAAVLRRKVEVPTSSGD